MWGKIMHIYLDNSATTKVCPEAAQAAFHAMTEAYGNPSSTHTVGRQSLALVDKARKSIADALGARPQEIFFTSCGTESDNWAIFSALKARKFLGKHIVSSKVEHSAVVKTLEALENEGYEVTYLPLQADGSVSAEDAIEAVRPDTALVTLMTINNETGGITDISAISKGIKAKKSRALLHTDAVQAFLKTPYKLTETGADLISISGHKVHAPKGIGALYIKSGIVLPSFMKGGEQERGKRAGTEAVPLISAFGAAVEATMPTISENLIHMASLKKLCVDRITAEIPSAKILKSDAPHILNLALSKYRSEVILNFLDAKGIYISMGSACKLKSRSYVLDAMQLPKEIVDGSIRLGFSRFNTIDEVNIFCDTLKEAHDNLLTVLR